MGTNGDSGRDGERFGEWIEDDPSENARRLAQSMHEVLNERNVSAIDEYHAEDLRYYRSSDELGNREDLKEDARMFLRGFPDLEVTVLEAFADDENADVVTIRYEIEGTHSKLFDTIPATNRKTSAEGIGIAAFDDGRVVEFSLVFDNLGLLQKLGIFR